MRLVKFKNGKWGIQRGWLFDKEYLGVDYWWQNNDYVVKYCMYNTEEEARKAAERYTSKNCKNLTEIESTYKL